LYQSKKIRVETKYSGSTVLNVNPVLADLLVSNLLQNAFRHNKEEGTITIELNEKQLIVSNTGVPLNIHPDELFVRFKKNDASKESLGLGLSIVKSICAVYGFDIAYEYRTNLHLFTINF